MNAIPPYLHGPRMKSQLPPLPSSSIPVSCQQDQAEKTLGELVCPSISLSSC